MTLRHVAVGDARYAVRVAGTGTPVLLLHGFTGTGRGWDQLARRLRAAGYRTVAPDLLGHGRSDAPPDPVRHDVARQAADLATVLATLDAVPAVVIGYSLGGRVALRLALDRPHVVRSLVLIGAGAGTADDRTRARGHAWHGRVSACARTPAALRGQDSSQPRQSARPRHPVVPGAHRDTRARTRGSRVHGLMRASQSAYGAWSFTTSG